MMKVLFITSIHPPFDTRIYHKMYKSIKKYGHNVKILLPNQTILASKNEAFRSFDGHRGKLARLLNNFKLMVEANKVRPELIIFFDPDLLPFMLIYKLFVKSTVIYDNHEDYVNFLLENNNLPRRMRKVISFIYSLFERLGLFVLDHIFYADNFTPQSKKTYNIDKVTVLYNYPILSEPASCEKEYDVIFPGSIDLCYDRILKIIDEIEMHQDLKLKFLVIGRNVSDNVKKEIHTYSRSLKQVHLIFLTDMEYHEVQDYIAKSRIGIIPLAPIKKMENNIPTKMFEYMMHCIPQIASDLPPIAHYLQHTHSGFCIQEDQFPKEYATRIKEILENYVVYSAYANEDRELLVRKWNWQIEERKLIETINMLYKNQKRIEYGL